MSVRTEQTPASYAPFESFLAPDLTLVEDLPIRYLVPCAPGMGFYSRLVASPLRPPSHSGKGAHFFTDTASDSSDRSFLVFFGFSLAAFVDAVAEARLKARTKANAKKWVRGVDNLTSIRQRVYSQIHSQRMEIVVETGTGVVTQSTQSTRSLHLPLRFVSVTSRLHHSTMASRRKNVKKGVQFTIMVVGKQLPSLVSLSAQNSVARCVGNRPHDVCEHPLRVGNHRTQGLRQSRDRTYRRGHQNQACDRW